MLMLPASSFWFHFLRVNRLDRHCRWLGLPGMEFRARAAWWGKAARTAPHEGIDLLFLVDSRGRRLALPPQALVVPLWEGEVVGLLDDFLGRTVVVRHPCADEQGRTLVSLYAHVEPLVGQGTRVRPDFPVARIAPGKQRGKSGPPAHLHISLAWLAAGYPVRELSWPTLWQNQAVELIDPLPVLPAPAGSAGSSCQ